ncbi:MAG TPA: hypothetical protein VKB58_13050 [Terriglobales bacterium]|jgi:hypothetical protein|nr:hypothetical protein [Terriglobales bacterium]
MSNKELFERVQLLLQRKLRPEECHFLALANKVRSADKKPLQKAAAASVKIA